MPESLIVLLLVIVLILVIAWAVLKLLPMQEPIRTVFVVVVLILIVYLLIRHFGGVG